MRFSEGAFIGMIGIAGVLTSCTDASTVTCGPGTMLQDDACVVSGSSPGGGNGLACGTGTHQDGATCLPNEPGLMCGTGTHQDGDACIPDRKAVYQLRAVTTVLDADGHTRMPVFVIGTNPDGSPGTDRVVLGRDRVGAGSWVDPSPTVGELGTMANFVPCNATTTPDCIGPARLTLALASDPTTILAHVDVELTMPEGVGSTVPCMVASKAMYFEGDGYIFSGAMTVTDATWFGAGSPNSIAVTVGPTDTQQGSGWMLDFNSRQLHSDLVTGVYEMAERASFAAPGHPGMDISGNGRGCNTLTGRFEVRAFELQPDHATTQRALITFEQHCEGGPTILRGCLRFEL